MSLNMFTLKKPLSFSVMHVFSFGFGNFKYMLINGKQNILIHDTCVLVFLSDLPFVKLLIFFYLMIGKGKPLKQ